MKKRFLLVLAAFFASVALHAQFIAQMSLLTPHYYPGEVYFKDGHVEEFAELELPRVGKHKLGVKKNSDPDLASRCAKWAWIGFGAGMLLSFIMGGA